MNDKYSVEGQCKFSNSNSNKDLTHTVKPLFFAGVYFLKIRENQTREKLPNSMIIVEKTREPRTLDPAESYKAADREK